MTGRSGCELDVVARHVTPIDTGCLQGPVPVALSYRRDDPFAVQMAFPLLGVAWLLSRDLLVSGIEGAAGHGDVHIQTMGGSEGDVTVITIGSRWAAQASFSFATNDLLALLALTDDIVPIGAESAFFDIDALLGEGPGGGRDRGSPSDGGGAL